MRKIKNIGKSKLKNEKGSVAVLTAFTIFMFIIILMGSYLTIMILRQSQYKSDARIQKIYGEDVDRIQEVYEELEEKIEQGKIKDYEKSYIEVSYIKSTGTQSINTNYFPKVNTKIEIDLKFDGEYKTEGENTFVGAYDSNNNVFSANFGAAKDQYDTIFMWTNTAYENGGEVHLKKYDMDILNTKNKFVLTRSLANYAGIETNTEQGTNNVNSSFVICGYNDGKSEQIKPFERYNMYVYGCKIYEDETIKMNLVPVIRTSDNEAGLYDKIENKFYGSIGTGKFIAQ